MLSHELSHVAHRDVTVMTIASFVGVLAGFLTRMALYSGMGSRRATTTALPVVLIITLVSVVVYALSFLLTRALSRYRELAADRAGAVLTGQPSALASALVKISGEMARIPTRDLRQAEPFNAFFFAPAAAPGFSLSVAVLHPPAARAPPRAARPGSPPSSAAGLIGEPSMSWLDKALGRSKPAAPDLDQLFAVPDAALTLESAIGVRPTGLGSVCFRAAEGGAFADRPPTTSRRCSTPTRARRSSARSTSTATPGCSCATSRTTCPGWSPSCTRSTPPCRTTGSARRCCARWSASATHGRRLGLVYLYKRGTFYPFAPAGGEQRDNALELQVRGRSRTTCASSRTPARWFPVWGAPGL